MKKFKMDEKEFVKRMYSTAVYLPVDKEGLLKEEALNDLKQFNRTAIPILISHALAFSMYLHTYFDTYYIVYDGLDSKDREIVYIQLDPPALTRISFCIQNKAKNTEDTERPESPIEKGLKDAVNVTEPLCSSIERIKKEQKGYKEAKGKTRWSLLTSLFPALADVTSVLEYGAKKYSKDNWQLVHPEGQYIDAALRHIFKMMQGEEFDAESGLPHVSHAITDLLFIAQNAKGHSEDFKEWVQKAMVYPDYAQEVSQTMKDRSI